MKSIAWKVWPVDPLVKIFRDDLPPDSPPAGIRIDAARNEYEHAQVAIRSEVNLFNCRVAFDDPRQESSGFVLEGLKAGFVGYVPVAFNSYAKDFPDEVLRQAPNLFPDPVWERDALDIPPRTTQPLWLTLKIPADAPPGVYNGAVRVTARDHTNTKGEVIVPISVQVYPVTVPDQRHLLMTNWYFIDKIAKRYNVRKYSPEFYAIFKKYLRHMAEHRQNVGLVPVLDLVDAKPGAGSSWRFSFRRLDRFVDLLIRSGLGDRLEGSHLAVLVPQGVDPARFEIVMGELPETMGLQYVESFHKLTLGSPAANDFLGALLPALNRHINRRGWAGRWIQHVADEPGNCGSELLAFYRDLVRRVRQDLPGIPMIDAVGGNIEDNGVDIPVILLPNYILGLEHIRKLEQAGRQPWYYICCAPGGHWPNRFLDFALVKTRILHWLNFFYGTPGYLHWGYNYWVPPDPYLEFSPPLFGVDFRLPPGDSHIVYPGPDGPVNSIRFDTQRDSAEDYELLRLLAERNPEKAKRPGVENHSEAI